MILPALAFLSLVTITDSCLRMKVTAHLSPCNRLQHAGVEMCQMKFQRCYTANVKQSTATCNLDNSLYVIWNGGNPLEAVSISCNEITFEWEIVPTRGAVIKQKSIRVECIEIP